MQAPDDEIVNAGEDANNDQGDPNDTNQLSIEDESVRQAILDRCTKIRPSLAAMMELGAEESVRAMRESERNRPPSPPVELSSDMSMETMNALLASNLVKLTSAEEERAQSESCYPIFKDMRDDFRRQAYLYDGIPFKIVNPTPLSAAYKTYHHCETIDWGPLEGWEVPRAIESKGSGYIFFRIVTTPLNQNDIRGDLVFFPNSDDDEVLTYDEVEGGFSDDMSVSAEDGHQSDGDDNISFSGNNGDDEYQSDNGEMISDETHENNVDYQSSELDVSNERDQQPGGDDDVSFSSEGEESYSEVETFIEKNAAFLEKHSVLQFNMRSFEPDEGYKENSWWLSDCFSSFSVTNNANDEQNRTEGENGFVTVFQVNETMAFEKGSKQKFISLENPRNYGTDKGSYHAKQWPRDFFPNEDNKRRMQVLERMKAYRGSWIAKLLSPSGNNLPEVVTELIAQYLTTSPPPYLIVQKGDLILLARYIDSVPDPDVPDELSNCITRELLVLARSLT